MKTATITTDHTTDLVYTDTGSILALIDTTQDAISAFALSHVQLASYIT